MKLIDKAAVMAEIERRINEIDEFGTYLSPKGTLTNLLCHLDTLEVKEVDLEREINEQALFYNYALVGTEEITAVAKRFYELGLNARKEE